ncbi:MAG: hypothetical protein SGJ18_06110 [Pseudomonadota bacterium]|nr:hypothetical protein [Pseudomonadota bacterium]
MSAFPCTDLKVFTNPWLQLNSVNNPRVFSLTVEKTGGPCDFFITISQGSSGDFNRKLNKKNAFIPYNVYRDPSLSVIVKALPLANQSEVISGKFLGTSNESKTFSVNVAFSPDPLKSQGLYSDVLKINIYKGAFSSGLVPQPSVAMINLSYLQPIYQSLSLVDSGSAFREGSNKHFLSFEPLIEGAVKTFDLLIRSNGGYSVKATSQNVGRLKHETLEKFVPYSLEVGGYPVNMGQRRSVLARSNQAQEHQHVSGGQRYPLSVKIGTTNKALAGRYNDYVTFTIEAD